MVFARIIQRKKPIIVFIHGWAMNSTSMETFEKVAYSLDISTINFDLPGHGKSAGEYGSVSSSVRAIRKLVGKNIPILVGYSLGGIIAQRYAEKYPVKGLFLISTTSTHAHYSLTKHPVKLSNVMTSVFSLSLDKKASLYFINFIRMVIVLRKKPKPGILDESLYDFSRTRLKNDLKLFYEGLKRTSLDVLYQYYIDIRKHHFSKPLKRVPSCVVCGGNDPFTSKSVNINLAKKLKCECIVLNKTTHLSIIQRKKQISLIFKKWLENNYKN